MKTITISIKGIDRVGVIKDIVSKLKQREFDVRNIEFNADDTYFYGKLICLNHRKISHEKIVAFLSSINSVQTVEVS